MHSQLVMLTKMATLPEMNLRVSLENMDSMQLKQNYHTLLTDMIEIKMERSLTQSSLMKFFQNLPQDD